VLKAIGKNAGAGLPITPPAPFSVSLSPTENTEKTQIFYTRLKSARIPRLLCRNWESKRETKMMVIPEFGVNRREYTAKEGGDCRRHY